MKKLLLSLGAIASVAAPVAAVVACGSDALPQRTSTLHSNKASLTLVGIKGEDITDYASAKSKLGVTIPDVDEDNAGKVEWSGQGLQLSVIDTKNKLKWVYTVKGTLDLKAPKLGEGTLDVSADQKTMNIKISSTLSQEQLSKIKDSDFDPLDLSTKNLEGEGDSKPAFSYWVLLGADPADAKKYKDASGTSHKWDSFTNTLTFISPSATIIITVYPAA